MTAHRPELLSGLAVLGTSAVAAAAAAGGPYRWEIALFRPVNELPDAIHPPVWTVMQLGALGAGPALGALAWRRDRRDLATRMVGYSTSPSSLAYHGRSRPRRNRDWRHILSY